MKTKFIKIISLFFIIAWPVYMQSQTIVTTAGSVTDCPGETVVPINVTNCNGVGAISLVLQFNTSVLTYLNYENLNPQLSSGMLIVNNAGDKLIISWANTTAANIGDGLLMDIRFSGTTGSTSLTWDTQTPGNCEYSNINGNILPSSYTNGTATIYQVPEILSQPVGQSVLEYGNATFSINAIAAGIEYQWFVSSNGGIDWYGLSNSSIYSGVTSSTLHVYNVLLGYNGFLFRCEISGTCDPVAVSEVAGLMVIEPLISTFDVQNVCPGNISIPVLTSNFVDIASFSLVFSYNYSVLMYDGFQNLNSLLPPGNFVCNENDGKLFMAWSGTSPVTFAADTMLVEILFTGLTGSSNLTWETETAGQCEYVYLDGSKVISVFENNNFTIYQVPQINTQPIDKLIPENTNISFSVGALAAGITYRWQESTNNGLAWTDLTNAGIYNGTTFATLNISNASLSMNGNWYRCRIEGTCTPPALSDPAVLNVLPKITAIAPSLSECPGPVTAAVDVTHFIDVASFSLALSYNPTVLTYEGYQALNAGLAGGNFTANAAGGKVFMTWSSTTPVTIGDAMLVELNFTGITGSTGLAWDTQTPGYCEFTNLEGQEIFSNYTDGVVTVFQPPAITTNPSNKTAPAGTQASFSVSATGTGLLYQWQESTDNGLNWNPISNGGSYSGATSSTLSINPVLWGMDQNVYRCRVSGTCPPVVYSNAALLDVIPEVIYTNAGSITNSCTGNILIPVSVTNCNNVGAISLSLNYDPSKLTFEGYEDVNAMLSGGMLIINNTGNQVKFSWASVNPLNLGSGMLIRYKFKANAGISTTLNWDIQTPGNCEYSDPDGFIYVMGFTNSSVSTAADAMVVSAGPDKLISPGGSVQIEGSVTGGAMPYLIQWSPTDWLDYPDILTPNANPPSTTNYTLTVTDDNGCTGADQMTVNIAAPGIDLNLKAFLEGPFNGSEMTTILNSTGKMPLTQPYSAPPWNYPGTETVTSLPNSNVVDWILVELRKTSGDASTATSATRLARKAGFILKNGNVVSIDGASLIHFDVTVTQNLFVVLWHRNHLGILSSNGLTESGGIWSWNFTTGSGQAFGGTDAQKQVVSGIWGMIAGDANGDGSVNISDKTDFWSFQAGKSGYFGSDYNLNGQVNNPDKNEWFIPNFGKNSQIPD